MNYYEYAPPIFRWLFGNTNIKPWELLPYLMWGTVIIAFIFIILALVPFFRKKRFKHQKWVQVSCLMSGLVLFYYGIQWDKYYLDYEFDNALSQPGIFIKKQVEADGYAKFSISILDEDPQEALVPNDYIKIHQMQPANVDNQIKLLDNNKCEKSFNTERSPYSYNEEVEVRQISKGNFIYYFPYDEASRFKGYKDGQCVEGRLNKPISRYYYIKESDRAGLGLRREKHYIVDTYTGEELSYQYRFRTARSRLYSMTLGLLDDFLPYGNNQTIQSPEGVVIKKYYPKEVYKYYDSMPEYFIIQTLIPSKIFHTSTQGAK